MKITPTIICILLILNFTGGIGGWNLSDKNINNIDELALTDNKIELNLSFTEPEIIRKFSNNFDRISLGDLDNLNIPGHPLLPFKPLKILFPLGQDIKDIEICTGKEIILGGGFNIEPGVIPLHSDPDGTPYESPINLSLHIRADKEKEQGTFQKLNEETNGNIKEPSLSDILINHSVYNSPDKYPGKLFLKLYIQNYRGYRILVLRIYPVQYIPKTGILSYFEEINVKITTKTLSNMAKQGKLMRNLPEDEERIKKIVDNPWSITSYEINRGTRSLVDPSSSYKYVIITNEVLNASFQTLIDWKNSKGVSATSVTIENITNDPDYNGIDTQEEIRNFIIDAYTNWGTEYVLLGGDDEVIPHRGVYGIVNKGSDHETEDEDIACDLYYGGLDGDWDNDNDGIYGEGDSLDGGNGTAGEEADFFAEVYIGRAPVNSSIEVQNFVNKVISYEQTPLSSQYLNNNLMLSAKLNDITDGGIASDNLVEYLPSSYSSTKLYERDDTASSSATTSELNSGQHIVNNIGHANPSKIGLACVDYHDYYEISEVDSLTNTEYFLFYSVGCYSNSFDNRWPDGSYKSDPISEHFILSNHGAFAYIGNTRYGWYSSGNPGAGSSDKFNTEFFDALFTENISHIGKTLQDSKEDLIGSVGTTGSMRWVYFDLSLLGDPETPYLGIGNPSTDLEVVSIDTHSENEIYSTESTYINSTIRNNGPFIESNFNVSLEVREIITPRYNKTLFFDDMEDYSHPDRGGKNLVEYNRIAGEWENGVPTNTTGPASAHSGSNCWGTNIDGNYNDYGKTTFSGVVLDQGIFVDVYGRNDFLDIPAQEGDNIYINISWSTGADLDLYLYKPEDVLNHQTTGFNYIEIGYSGSTLYEDINYTIQPDDGNGIFQVRVNLFSGGDTSYTIEEITVDGVTYTSFDYPYSLKRVDDEGVDYEYPEATYHYVYIPYYPYRKFYVDYTFSLDVDFTLYDPDGDVRLSNSLDNDGYWWGSYYADEAGLWKIKMMGEGPDHVLDNYTLWFGHPYLWTTLEMPSIDLSDPGIESSHLSFWHWYDIEKDYDFAFVFISPNGGDWWYYLESYTGNNSLNGWTQERISLDYFIGYSEVIVMFGFTSDEYVTKAGWYIDDIAINVTIAPTEMTVYGPINNTISGELLPGNTISVSWNYNFNEEGRYRIIVRTHLSLDYNESNNQKSVKINTDYPLKTPVIYSHTHPNEDLCYIDNNPVLSWTTASEYTDYVFVDMDEAIISSDPDMNYDSYDYYGGAYVGHNISWNITGRTYLKFNLSGLPSNISITTAKLYVFLYDEFHYYDEPIGVWFCINDSWDNKTITWNNAPPIPGSPTDINNGSFFSYNWYTWNITSDFQTQYFGDKILTEILRDMSETSDTFKYFVEMEYNNVLGAFIKYTYTTINTSEIAGYSYILDNIPTNKPDSIINDTVNYTSYSNLTNGIWYFHVKTMDNEGIWSGVDHFTIRINNSFIRLDEGWNLISLPLIQNEQDLIKVLETINGNYDAVQRYNILDKNDPWNHHKVDKPFGNDLFELNETMGFWIHITQPGDTIFLYNGTAPTSNQTIPLHPGWNMVGYPSLTNYNRTEGLNNLTFDDQVDAIWSYDASTQKWEEMGESDYFIIGRGYYIHAKSECEWEVPIQ